MQIFSIRVQTLSEKVFISPEVLKSLWAMCAFAAGLVFVEGEVFNDKNHKGKKQYSFSKSKTDMLLFHTFLIKFERFSPV